MHHYYSPTKIQHSNVRLLNRNFMKNLSQELEKVDIYNRFDGISISRVEKLPHLKESIHQRNPKIPERYKKLLLNGSFVWKLPPVKGKKHDEENAVYNHSKAKKKMRLTGNPKGDHNGLLLRDLAGVNPGSTTVSSLENNSVYSSGGDPKGMNGFHSSFGRNGNSYDRKNDDGDRTIISSNSAKGNIIQAKISKKNTLNRKQDRRHKPLIGDNSYSKQMYRYEDQFELTSSDALPASSDPEPSIQGKNISNAIWENFRSQDPLIQSYFFENIGHHLIQADQIQSLKNLLLSYKHVRNQVSRDPAILLGQFKLIPGFPFDCDPSYRQIYDAIVYGMPYFPQEFHLQIIQQLRIFSENSNVSTFLQSIYFYHNETVVNPNDNPRDQGKVKQKIVVHHLDVIQKCILTPNSRFVIILNQHCRDVDIRFRKSGEFVCSLKHSENVTDVAMSLDGNYVVTATESGLISVWNWISKQVAHRVRIPHSIFSIETTAQRTIAVVYRNMIKLYRLQNRGKKCKLHGVFSGHTRPITAIHVSNDYLITACKDMYVRKFNLHSEKQEAFGMEYEFKKFAIKVPHSAEFPKAFVNNIYLYQSWILLTVGNLIHIFDLQFGTFLHTIPKAQHIHRFTIYQSEVFLTYMSSSVLVKFPLHSPDDQKLIVMDLYSDQEFNRIIDYQLTRNRKYLMVASHKNLKFFSMNSASAWFREQNGFTD